MTERKTILVYNHKENQRGRLYTLLGDYFNVILLKSTHGTAELMETVKEVKADCAIISAFSDYGCETGAWYSKELPIILTVCGVSETQVRFANEANPSGGLFRLGDSSDVLMKLVDKAIGFPEKKNKRYFALKDEKSDKYWSIEKTDSSFLINYGKVGSEGQKTEKTFSTEEDCQKEIDKLIAAKTKKGYVEIIDKSFVNND
jgi:predicted DNA-binding WGR domain protein